MKPLAAFLALVILAGCGADGAPIRPKANVGVGIGPNGLTTSARVGANKGPVSVSVGL